MWVREKGFTLIELLVVIGILMVLVAIALVAVNPSEQLNKTADVSEKTVAVDLSDAAKEYFATYQEYPWDKNTACKNEVDKGGALSTMPDCLHELINSGKLESDYTSKNDVADMEVSKCGKAAVVCYDPKSKIEQVDAETHYDKYGVNDPGCPGNGSNCYWCHPLGNPQDCTITPIPSPTVTPIPTATPTPDYNTLYGVGGYKLDDTKFFQTYAVVSFTDPGFPATTTQPDAQGGVDSGWMIDLSFRPDFGGTTVVDGFGYFVNGVPVSTDADTDLWATGAGNFYADWAAPSVKAYQTNLTPKHFGFVSMPFEWSKYVNGCGKTIYWRVVNFRTGIPGVDYDSDKFSPTYSNTIDCSTKVGVWTGIYYPPIDISGDGVIDFTDYIIASLQTRLRAGGWQPPE